MEAAEAIRELLPSGAELETLHFFNNMSGGTHSSLAPRGGVLGLSRVLCLFRVLFWGWEGGSGDGVNRVFRGFFSGRCCWQDGGVRQGGRRMVRISKP